MTVPVGKRPFYKGSTLRDGRVSVETGFVPVQILPGVFVSVDGRKTDYGCSLYTGPETGVLVCLRSPGRRTVVEGTLTGKNDFCGDERFFLESLRLPSPPAEVWSR